MKVILDDEIEAISSYYRTPSVSFKSYMSFRKFYPNIPLVIVNNSDNIRSCSEVKELYENIDKLQVICSSRNLGHGLGLNRGIEESKFRRRFIFVFDSDCVILKPGLLESIVEKIPSDNFYGAGWIFNVTSEGTIEGDTSIKYLFPVAALLNRLEFYNFPKFVEDMDCPFLPTMKAIKSREQEYKLINVPEIWDYVMHLGGEYRNGRYINPYSEKRRAEENAEY